MENDQLLLSFRIHHSEYVYQFYHCITSMFGDERVTYINRSFVYLHNVITERDREFKVFTG